MAVCSNFLKYRLSLCKATDKIVFHERDIDDSLRLRRTLQPRMTDLLSSCESIVLYDYRVRVDRIQKGLWVAICFLFLPHGATQARSPCVYSPNQCYQEKARQLRKD